MINGTPRSWSNQTDGPALQTLAILNFLQGAYQGQTVNLWEEETGASFFARAVQLRCLQGITANTFGIPAPGWLSTAIPRLENALQDHWNGQYYQSLLPVPALPD